MRTQLPTSGARVVPDPRPRLVEGGGESDSPERLDAALLLVLRDLVRLAEAGLVSRPDDPDEGVLLDTLVEHDRYVLWVVRESHSVNLSPRERQIARLVAAGHTNRAIASGLEISTWTVSTHLRRIFAKLGVSSRAEMVAHVFGPPAVPPQAHQHR